MYPIFVLSFSVCARNGAFWTTRPENLVGIREAVEVLKPLYMRMCQCTIYLLLKLLNVNDSYRERLFPYSKISIQAILQGI